MSPNDKVLLTLGEISGKLDAALQRMDRDDKDRAALEERVTVLERGRAWLVGAGATFSVIATMFVSTLTDIFTRS